MVDWPSQAEEVKAALLTVLKDAPSGAHVTASGEELNIETLSSADVQLGVMSEQNTESGKSDVVLLEDGEDITAKTIAWKLRDEKFVIESYPEDDE